MVTSLVFPFVPEDVPLPWGTFALPILRHGLIAPNLLHAAGSWAAVVVPLGIASAAVTIGSKKRPILFAGAALWLLIGLLWPVSAFVRVERGYVEEAYFEQDGAIRKETPPDAEVAPELLQRAALERRRPPTSWPF